MKLEKVYDGDTLTVTIPGYPAIFGRRVGVRVRGIDTPEIRGFKTFCEAYLARVARDEASRFLKSGGVIHLKRPERGKYFRIVADVRVGNRDLASYLVSKRLAVRYDGGTKSDVDWCRMGEVPLDGGSPSMSRSTLLKISLLFKVFMLVGVDVEVWNEMERH